MAVKHFCDLCGEPALPNAYHYTVIRARGTPREFYREFYVDAGFHILSASHPKTNDDGGDVCSKCMINGLEQIIINIKARAEST